MASQHIRAQRFAHANLRLEAAQNQLIEALKLEVEVPEPLKGEALRDSELVMIRRLENAAQVLEKAAEAPAADSDNDSDEILEDIRAILTPHNRAKEDGEDESLIETLNRVASEPVELKSALSEANARVEALELSIAEKAEAEAKVAAEADKAEGDIAGDSKTAPKKGK